MESTNKLQRTRVIQISLDRDLVGQSSPFKPSMALNANSLSDSKGKNQYENKYSSPYSSPKNDGFQFKGLSKENNATTPILRKTNVPKEESNLAYLIDGVRSPREINDLCDQVLERSRRFGCGSKFGSERKNLQISDSKRILEAKYLSVDTGNYPSSTRAIGRIKKQAQINLDSPKKKIVNSNYFSNLSPIVAQNKFFNGMNETDNTLQLFEIKESVVETNSKNQIQKTRSRTPINNENIGNALAESKEVFELKFWSLKFSDSIEKVGLPDEFKKVKVNYKSGMYYIGIWKDGKRNGFGELFNSNGNLLYCGEWKDDEIHGFGRIKNTISTQTHISFDHSNLYSLSSKWRFLEGKFRNGVAEGKCKLKLANEDELESVFTEGKANGKSVWRVNGKSIPCIFSDNRLILKLASN